jgi:hypothetical protein
MKSKARLTKEQKKSTREEDLKRDESEYERTTRVFLMNLG